jgi:hypothetical protein
VAEPVAEEGAEPAVAEEEAATVPAEEPVPDVPVVAEVVAEEPVAEPEPEPVAVEADAPSGLSAEEELAAISLETGTEAPAKQEEVEAIPITDEVWDVPQLVPAQGVSQIRFAEDIMVPRAGGRGERRGRRRGGDGETSKARKAAARKNRAAAPPASGGANPS